MEILFEKISMIYEFILFYPKSTTTSVILLLIVIVIAFFINRKRDASGRISFIDKSTSGVIGIRVYEIDDGYRKKSWLFPLWIAEKALLLNVKMLLPRGEYHVKAYWRTEVSRYVKEGFFTARPIEKEKAHSLSGVGKFEADKETPIEFRLIVSDKKVQIDSPNKSALKSDPAKTPFPLVLSDPSLKKLATKLEKTKGKKIWELSITDDRILTKLKNEIKGEKRKMESVVIKNKELKSDLDQVVRQLKKSQESNPEKKAASDPEPKN